MIYEIKVIETKLALTAYIVEANSLEEVNEKAQDGDTIREEHIKDLEVIERRLLHE